MFDPIILVALAGGIAAGILVGWFMFSKGKKISMALQAQINEKERELSRLDGKLTEAKNQIRAAEAEAKATAKEILSEAKVHVTEMEAKLEKDQGRIEEKERSLDTKAKEVERQRSNLDQLQRDLEADKKEVSVAAAKHREALESVAKLSQDEAKKQLWGEIEKEFSDHFATQLRLKKEQMEEEAEEKAKNLMAEAMQRYASEVSSESTATVVQLPSDDIKGKIIGKEGRNIIAFEQATGVDVIIDDTPGAIILSGFDLARRYVAKLSMEKLVQDGRIQPARIEEIVGKMKEQVGKMMLEFGKRATEELGIQGYPQDLLKIIGRLRFRTSYGQNVLKHSVEMAHLGRMLAEEMGANVQVVTEGCLLHDIGKALDHEVQGTHVEIGRRILQKFGVSEEVIKAMQAHHEEYPYETPESVIVQVADAISGGRPGARRDSVENYLKRLSDIEAIANSFASVEKSYAISAGREVRVFVKPDEMTDLAARELARNIALRIESDLKYPGEIKVMVIRETRAIEFAR